MSYDNTYIETIGKMTEKPINGKNIKLIKKESNLSENILHFDMSSLPIKVTTDFSKYCVFESVIDDLNFNNINIELVFLQKTVENILLELSKIDFISNMKTNSVITYNSFHTFQKLDEFSKVTIDYNILEKTMNSTSLINKNNVLNKIPKELLLSPIQINKLIINEMKKINRNKDYNHYIVSDMKDPYKLLFYLKFDKIEKPLEFSLTVDPKMYPYIPPKLEYITPKIKLPLLIALMNIDILKLENWNPTITIEHFITSLANQLDPIIKEYIMEESTKFNELDYMLIKLTSITKEYSSNKINIKIDAPKFSTTSMATNDKYWKAGTGYGHNDGGNNWDIKAYIKEQEIQKNEIASCLATINKYITFDTMHIINDSILLTYISKQINSLNLLEFNNNKPLYIEIFNILVNLLDKDISQSFVNIVADNVRSIFDELEMLMKTNTESLNDEVLLNIYSISDNYITRYKEPVKMIVIPNNIKEEYCGIMKKLQFGSYDTIPNDHRFGSQANTKPEQKSLMRMLGEISSFKSGLPLHWESSIWVRVPKNSFNVFSFLISGPKDTPYENGLFEFHAMLPSDYPNGIPQVLLHTTGNDTVRFNPNLYNSGKVCLSILGTWKGQESESWQPKTSTFMQVMTSIQSLILVEQPCFNEPGWEREMNTPKGKKLSEDYNEEKEPHTISLAMTNMILHPPKGFEEVVANHFRMKKEEIINKTLIWVQSATKYKQLMETNRSTLIKLLEKL